MTAPNELAFEHQFVRGTSARTLLLLHGTGGDEHELLSLGKALDPTATLLSPRGKISENGRLRFFRRFAEGVFDLEDLKRRTDELADFILAAAAHYQLDLSQTIAVGYSNGANVAVSVMLQRPEILRAAILLRAMIPFAPAQVPNLSGTRIWLAGGRHDTIIPPEEVERLEDMLTTAGAEVTARYLEAGHGLTNTELVLAHRWLQSWS